MPESLMGAVVLGIGPAPPAPLLPPAPMGVVLDGTGSGSEEGVGEVAVRISGDGGHPDRRIADTRIGRWRTLGSGWRTLGSGWRTPRSGMADG
jgi:hypothetical protein